MKRSLSLSCYTTCIDGYGVRLRFRLHLASSFIILINAAVSILGFSTLNFLLKSILDVGVLAVFIIFQPEIRKLLYNLGQNTSFSRFFNQSTSDTLIEEVVEAVRNMSHSKTGALIVFTKNPLQDLVDAGVNLDAKINSELIQTIFQKETPLHDGAVIIRDNRIVAASCYLADISKPQYLVSFRYEAPGSRGCYGDQQRLCCSCIGRNRKDFRS